MAGGEPPVASHEFSEPDDPVLRFARAEAVALGHSYVGAEHLLLALLRGSDPEVIQALSDVGITTDELRAALLETLPPGEKGGMSQAVDLPCSSRARKVLRFVDAESRSTGRSAVTGARFLRAILREDQNIAARVLYRLGMPGQKDDRSTLQALADQLTRAGLR